jgi:hypothetical protein
MIGYQSYGNIGEEDLQMLYGLLYGTREWPWSICGDKGPQVGIRTSA